MAPTPPPTTARRPLTLKGLPRKKPGPVPKPLSERLKGKPMKPLRRVERSYTRERKIEVLMYLLNHRIPDNRHRRQVPRSRVGQSHEQDWTQSMIQNESGEYVWHRAPTYAEASQFWKIPTPTIQGWWDSRKKLFEGSGIELPENVSPDETPTPTPTPSAKGRAQVQEPARGAAVERRDAPPPAENRAPPAMPSGPAPSPDQTRDPAVLNTAPLPAAARGPRSPTRIGTQPPPAAHPTPTAARQQSLATNGVQLPAPPVTQAAPVTQAPPVNHTPPVARPPLAKVGRPVASSSARPSVMKPALLAPRPTPQPDSPHLPSAPQPAQPPVAHTAPPHAHRLPPALDPANYAVVYMGPHPGPFPEQPSCLPPGTLLPVVYSGQPLNVPPVTYLAVYPSHTPVSYGVQPQHLNGMYNSPYPPPYPGHHHPQHGRSGSHGAHHPSYQNQHPQGAYPPYAAPPQGHPAPSPPYRGDSFHDRPCPPPKFLEKLLPLAPPRTPAAQEPPTPVSSGPPPSPSPATLAAQAEMRKAAGLLLPARTECLPALAGPDQRQPSATVPSTAQFQPTNAAGPAENTPGRGQEQEGEGTDASILASTHQASLSSEL